MHHTSVTHQDFLALQIHLIAPAPDPFMEPPAQAHDPPPDRLAPEPMDLAPVQPEIPGFETPSLTSVSINGMAVQPRPARFQRDFYKAPVPGKLARPKPAVQAPPPKIRFRSDELDLQPERISMINPVYPYRAKRMGIQGSVAVRFLVDRTGAVRKLTILEANPPDIFNDTVMKTLEKWTFKPGRKDGKDVETWITTQIRFELE